MQRYLRIYKTFFVTSLARELEFRASFFAKVLQNIVWTSFFLLILLVIYRTTPSIAGWSRGDAFILAATCFLMEAIAGALFMSLMEIPEQVRQGTLDFVLTKPIDSQFWVSVRKFNFSQIGTLFAGIAMVTYGAFESGISPALDQWLAYVLLVLAAVTILYSFHLMLMTTGIWLVRVDNIWVLGESVMQVSRYPLDIYSSGLQKIFTFVLPLAFISTIPSRQLVKGIEMGMVAIGCLWALAFLGLARWFWNFALTRYGSASS